MRSNPVRILTLAATLATSLASTADAAPVRTSGACPNSTDDRS